MCSDIAAQARILAHRRTMGVLMSEDLLVSQKRLEAQGIGVATKGAQVRPILLTAEFSLWLAGWQVWNAAEMAAYCESGERERGIILGLKGIQ